MLKKSLLIMLMLALFTSPAFSQNTFFPQVEVSQRTTEQGGKLYYVHHVEPKQTFYSICKAYGVSVDDIYQANPGGALNRGLKAGMDILIPCKEDPMEKQLEALQVVTVANAEDTVKHAVEEIIVHPQPEVVYLIPEDVEYVEYRVKWFDTIYTIAKKYNISVEAIEFLNKIENRIVETGQKLKLPKEQFAKFFQNLDSLIAPQQEEPQEEIQQEEEIKPILPAEPFRGEAKVALILPFDADASEPDYNYYDFYSGFLMGVNDLKNQGMNISLDVLDEYNYGLNDTYNFIVGPVFSDDLQDILAFSNDYQIPVVSPLDPSVEALVESNPYLIQVPASTSSQIENMVSSIELKPYSDNVIVIHESDVINDTYYNSIIAELAEQEIPYKDFSYNILKGRDISETLVRSYLKNREMNHVIIASEKEFFASDAIRNMSILTIDSTACKITGYGSQRLRNFETIETEAYENINMHFSTNYYIDYADPNIRDFVFKFRALYGTEPNTYAFHGHDIATYFLNSLNQYGENFIYHLENNPQKMMQSKIHLHKKEDGGLSNKATINIIYQPNYQIVTD